jgi:hypothetical protein
MVWRNVIKKLFIASIPTILIPVICIWYILKHFGISETSLLGIMALAQIYIVWAQLEISLRQSHLSTFQYEPVLKLEREILEGNNFYYLRNVSQNLARNVKAEIIIGKGKEERSEFFQLGDIAFNEKKFLGNLSQFEKENTIQIDINYENIFGDFKGVSFIKEPKFSEFLSIPSSKKLPGILLNSFEELGLIFTSIYLFYFKKKRRISKS